MCGDCYAAEQWYEHGEEIEKLKAERDQIMADRAQADAEGHAYLDRAKKAEAEVKRQALNVLSAQSQAEENYAELARYKAAVKAVRKVHGYRIADDGETDWCDECQDDPWPCATVARLDKYLEET